MSLEDQLFKACWAGDLKEVKRLHKNGADLTGNRAGAPGGPGFL